MKIRQYANTVGFTVVGRLHLVGKWDLCTRWYADDAGNAYLVNVVIGGIRIIPARKEKTL